MFSPAHQTGEQIRHGQNEKPNEQVAHAVNYIKGKPRTYPGKSLLEGETVQYRLNRSIERAEKKPVQSAYDRINHSGNGAIHSPRQKHGHAPQSSPNVKIRYPPRVKSRVEAVQKNVNVNWYQSTSPERDCVCNGQHSEQVDVGQRLHYHF